MVLLLKSLEIWRAISCTRFFICSAERSTLGYSDRGSSDQLRLTPLPQHSLSSPRSGLHLLNCWQSLERQGTLASRRSGPHSQSPAISSAGQRKIAVPTDRVAATLLLSW